MPLSFKAETLLVDEYKMASGFVSTYLYPQTSRSECLFVAPFSFLVGLTCQHLFTPLFGGKRDARQDLHETN